MAFDDDNFEKVYRAYGAMIDADAVGGSIESGVGPQREPMG
jgi:hypothetical protein